VTITLSQAVQATGARTINAGALPADLRVVTDSRALQPGDTFLALRGERHDGHAFVHQARERGAAAVIVEDVGALSEGDPALLVSDTKHAYMDLAAAARASFPGTVIAITGSAGKTTTKELLAQLLVARYGSQHVLAAVANENNEIGVSKLLLAASPEHRAIVVEMGARHEGEIADLARIARPHVGILTNIGEAHLEIFGSRENLARTKWGLFSTGARAVLNMDDTESVNRAALLQVPPLWFGTRESSRPGVYLLDDGTLIVNDDESYRAGLRVTLPGRHNRQNLAAALAGAHALGVSLRDVGPVVERLQLPEGRYQTIALPGKPRVIYDAYNASPAGMLAALDAFSAETASRRIAVLASMAELGSDAPAMHERVGAHAAACGVDVLLVGGDYAQSLEQGALARGLPRERLVHFLDNAQAARWLRAHATQDDAVLLKGSRKYKMEEIVQSLLGAAAG
jgi:UDP-N-acetylmuramoyl-tripeptide--D-alanyl-D-alanine ligase